MPFDKFVDLPTIWEERRKNIRESLRSISIDELKKIVKKHEEEFVENPARDEFLRLMEEQPQASFYTAVPQKDVVVYYCRDAQFGVWVVAGSGIGPLDAHGKGLIQEAIEGPLTGAKFGVKK